MTHTLVRGRSLAAVLLAGIVLSVLPAQATVVRFDTSLGSIDVRLYDSATPLSVANFLSYLTAGYYTNSIIHRSVPGFVIQGGGYYSPPVVGGITSIPESAPIPNEPGISNLRGTLAYAKLGGDPNSATSEWFFNLEDNSENLDNQNGGFTVFGRVVGNGMNVVDAISDLGIVAMASPFDELPVLDYEAVVARGIVYVSDAVFVNSISVRSLPAGDYTGDGIVDASDHNVWKSTFGSTTDAEADGNGDGIVDAADYTVWRDSLAGTGGPPGDYDDNGLVNDADYAAWRAGFGMTVTAGTGADGNGDGVVDAADYTVWRDNVAAGSGAATVTAIVPEPAAAVLLLAGLAVLLLAGVRRRRA
jgi:cyclophilin family peptidyl-prolyl cis-trans isomerase